VTRKPIRKLPNPMIQFLNSFSPKTQARLALLFGGAVIAFFLMTLIGFFSIREEAREDDRLDKAARLAQATDTDFQLAVSKGKNFAILKDETNKARTLAYFKEAQDNFTQLSQLEQDPQGRQLLYRLGAGLHSAEFPLGILTSTAKKSDSAEKLYSRYLKDITIDFDNAGRDYLGFLDRKIQGEESEVNGKILLDLLLASAGIFLGLAGMGFGFSISQNLKQSEAKFRGLIENSHDLITVLDRDGKRIYESPSLQRILGYKPGERTGSTFETQPPEDQEKARRVFAEVLAKPGVPIKVRLRARHKDGHLVEADMISTNLLDDPAVRGIVVNGRDVTESKRVEEALRESEEKFRNLIENSHDVLSITNKDGRMTYISPSVKRVLGYEPSERTGRGYLEIMHPEDVERIRGEFGKLLGKSGSTWTVQFRLRHKDGSWRYVESTGTNLLENPAVQGIVYNLRDITGKVEAETALRKSEEHFRTLIEKSHDVISLVQGDGMTRYVTPSIKKVMGYDPEEREGKPYFEIVHPEDLGAIQEFFQYLLRNPGVTLTSQARLRHRDGRWRHVEGSATNLIDNPDIGAIVLNYRDITEKFEAEAAVRRSEENFRNLIEKAPDAVFITREDDIIYVNSKTLALLGYDEKEEILGRPALDIVHPEDRRTVTSRIQILNQGGRTYPAEIRMLKRDGAETGVEASSIAIQFEGKPAIMVSLRDITLRKQAEAVARENQQRYQSLVESMPDAVMIHDEENILYVNPSAVKMFGAQSEADILSKPFWVVVPYEFREAVRTRLKAVIEKGASNELAERKLRRLDETQIDVLVTSVPFYDRGRRVVLAIFLDITALKEAERKAQRFQRLAALGEMAAGMAHEIRNPTAAISAQAQYLLKKLEGNGTTYEQLKDILQQCDRLETLVHDTLDYSPEKKFEERSEVPAKELLQKALWLAQTQFGPSHARVKAELDLPRDPLMLRVHPSRMERVLVNLILNAFQAMPEGGKLRLKAEHQGNKVALRIEDNGKGIAEEEMPRLFEPFFTSRKMGSGLGLAICQKIVEEHKGQIKVERVKPHGAAFTIELPLEKEAVS
jgi:PAS domain S-box-containing protein